MFRSQDRPLLSGETVSVLLTQFVPTNKANLNLSHFSMLMET